MTGGSDLVILIRVALGIVFFLLGLVGLALPVLPGWLFFGLAAILFIPQHRASEWVLARVETRAPRVGGFLRRIGVGRRRV